MERKIVPCLIALIFSIVTMVYASTVTTMDGQNFSVTNDSGFQSNMTMQQIKDQYATSSSRTADDSVQYLADSEISYSWGAVQYMANQALTNWQANQVNSVNSVNGT